MREVEDVELTQAVALFKTGLSMREVGKELGVSKSQAQRLHDQAKQLGLFNA